MKIAIMTQPLGMNYGGILQAWALQQIIKKMGHRPITIDRQIAVPGAIYRSVRFGHRVVKKAIGQRKTPINLERNLPYVLQHTRLFVRQHVDMSELLDTTAKLRNHFMEEQYDAVIVGSDQTWRPKYSPNIYNFFLDFLDDDKIKRISYASSFGVDTWEFTDEQTVRCAELASKFDALSVREDSGVLLCQRYLDVEAKHVLDPTLLLEKEDYNNLIGVGDIDSHRGVYSYLLDKTPSKERLVAQVSNLLGERSYSCQAKCEITDNTSSDIDDYVKPCPREWLAGFLNARFVVTDSFHGMVFSILFEKDFVVIGNKERGLSRFYSLLGSLGLQSRLVSNYEDLSKLVKSNIDYALVEPKLAALKKKSMSFLSVLDKKDNEFF